VQHFAAAVVVSVVDTDIVVVVVAVDSLVVDSLVVAVDSLVVVAVVVAVGVVAGNRTERWQQSWKVQQTARK